ncbi:23S rRNA pseudouridine synthase F [Candidatus Uhrbacteria bacterium CG10_big_fil_rev_8_21_14_0_10_50_16]|uniref:Pseudouridine synthase n=1 Tax=Candidatus Uhrbacteria bacterium CG10_big_fil_rev_8_21_14_0_10_50_16 TaxID=1975039 RepID=A0A2H0RN47_9BACT|nr:MAG: 23S rRNA pseudouridine synthase F [Candidatus Uhrbacteria bacterium CG10_big_fil_rev_8_21_14_0_10_50_16]
MRINKYLANHGVCSRREADRLIEAGSIRINDRIAVLGDDVGEDDIVFANNAPVNPETDEIYLAYHKPRGVEVTHSDDVAQNLPRALGLHEHVFAVGRLDKDSSGLLLVTNDGDIVNKILKPIGGHEKEYLVHVRRPLTKDFLEKIAAGVPIDGRPTRAATVERQNKNAFKIVITEGRNRQIRKMVETLGNEVTSLKRTRVMNIKLGHLKQGQARPLSNKEKSTLFKLLGDDTQLFK